MLLINCCGGLEAASVVLRFSCPFLSLFIVLCLRCCKVVALFCFGCHMSGAGHATSFLLVFVFFIIFVSLSVSFFSLSTHLDCSHLSVVPTVSSTMAG